MPDYDILNRTRTGRYNVRVTAANELEAAALTLANHQGVTSMRIGERGLPLHDLPADQFTQAQRIGAAAPRLTYDPGSDMMGNRIVNRASLTAQREAISAAITGQPTPNRTATAIANGLANDPTGQNAAARLRASDARIAAARNAAAPSSASSGNS